MAKPWRSPPRIYLTGRVAAELGGRLLDERRLPARRSVGVRPSPETEALEHALRAAPPRERR